MSRAVEDLTMERPAGIMMVNLTDKTRPFYECFAPGVSTAPGTDTGLVPGPDVIVDPDGKIRALVPFPPEGYDGIKATISGTGFVPEPIEVVEADREETPAYRKWYASLCDCTCAGSECPAGKMGSMTRCSTEDLRVLALKLRSEARRLSLAVATATRDRDAALAKSAATMEIRDNAMQRDKLLARVKELETTPELVRLQAAYISGLSKIKELLTHMSSLKVTLVSEPTPDWTRHHKS